MLEGNYKYYTFWIPDNGEYTMHDEASSQERERRYVIQDGMHNQHKNKDLTLRLQKVETM